MSCKQMGISERSAEMMSASAYAGKPKLKVQRNMDSEADVIANRVPRMPDSVFIQRKCSHCEEEEKAQRKPLGSFIQKKEAGNGNIASEAVLKKIKAMTNSGDPLAQPTKSFMESRFGADFSNVRIHTGEVASQLSSELNAQAFTVGRDVYFNQGRYAPQTLEGKHLLAHELTHTLQQTNGKADGLVQRASWGEMWGAFWGAGPIDSYRANELAEEALSRAQTSGLPGLHNGAADAFRHCYWNCRMKEVIGEEDAEDIANNHEEHGGGPAIENSMDNHNNAAGRTCDGSCNSCCFDLLSTGRLRVIDRGVLTNSSRPTGATTPAPISEYKRY